MIKRTLILILAITMTLGISAYAADTGKTADIKTISAGEYHTVAIAEDGTLWAWGYNSVGQLGDGTTSTRLTPVKIMDNVVAVSAGASHTVAIQEDGSVWAWGSNMFGQLGDGTRIDRHTPVKVMDGAVAVLAGAYSTTAVREGEHPWIWEGAYYGEADERAIPPEMMDGMVAVSAGRTHTVALKADGSVWTLGENRYGQLGDGTVVSRYSPIKIMDDIRVPIAAKELGITATPIASTVFVNGEAVAFDAYNINGSNYFKLRDLAYALNGTAKQFSVEWDASANAITITSGAAYTAVGGEMESKGVEVKKPTVIDAKTILNGDETLFAAYNIDGSNYFKLRDIGATMDFAVDWDADENAVMIDTNMGYVGENLNE